jgi:aspartate 1-decarboxylase
MNISLLKCKIHRATVTRTELSYVGSITIDKALMDAAGLVEYEKTQVVDINNGSRFETYCIAGEAGSGVICVNGAAARMVLQGDLVIIMAYCGLTPEEARAHKPVVLFVDEHNAVRRKSSSEKHGPLV